jgi:hypothetical protein
MFRLTVSPSTGLDYVDGGDDAGNRNLYKQLPRKVILNSWMGIGLIYFSSSTNELHRYLMYSFWPEVQCLSGLGKPIHDGRE